MLEIPIFTLRNFINLCVLRYLGICNVVYNGVSGPSLLVESTNSMIWTLCCHTCTVCTLCACIQYVLYHDRENLPGHFKFKEYCPRVFHDLRKRFEVDDIDYMVSYIYCSRTYIYCTLAKEGPWAVHLTLGQDWGIIFKVSVSCLYAKERPGKLPTLAS